MRREWVLWNALGSPERIVEDERMEAIERKGDYWNCRILNWMIYAFDIILIFGNISEAGILSGSMPVRLLLYLLLGLLSVTALSRFLYSCYHGTQEISGRGSGMKAFLENGVGAGLWALLGAVGYWGFRDIRFWGAFILGLLFYALLCHFAYFYYAWAAEEENEKRRKKAGILVTGICAFSLAAYGLFVSFGIARMFSGNIWMINGKLTEEEREYAAAVMEGRERYEELESVKLEWFYNEAGEDETAPYQNGVITHSYYWITPENLYSMVLDPVTGEIYREGYRDAEMNWYAAAENSWAECDTWGGTGFQPYVGIASMQTDAVEEIRKTYRDGGTVYTVIYGPNYETIHERFGGEKDSRAAGALEEYTLNEFGVLSGYVLEEYRLSEEGERICAQRRAFTLLNGDLVENEEEVRELIGQYEQI